MNLYQQGKQFVALVQKNDVLWNKKNGNFKNSDLRNQTWAEVGAVFGLTGEQASQAFVSLRQKYIREKDKVKKSEKSGIKLKKIWFLFDMMRFLDDVIQQRRTHFALSYVPPNSCEGSNDVSSEPEEKMLETELHSSMDALEGPDPLFIKMEPPQEFHFTDVSISPSSTPTPQVQHPTPGTSKSASPEPDPEPEPEPEPELEVNKKEVIPKKRKARETDLSALIAAVKAPVKIQHEDNWEVKEEVKMFCKFLGTRLDKLPGDVRRKLENEIMERLFTVENSL